MNMQEMAQALTDAGAAVGDVGTQLSKALGEISDDIGALQGTIAAGAQTTPEVDAAFAGLMDKISAAKAVAQSLDDIVLDPTAPAPADAPAPPPADSGDAGATTTP